MRSYETQWHTLRSQFVLRCLPILATIFALILTICCCEPGTESRCASVTRTHVSLPHDTSFFPILPCRDSILAAIRKDDCNKPIGNTRLLDLQYVLVEEVWKGRGQLVHVDWDWFELILNVNRPKTQDTYCIIKSLLFISFAMI